MNAVHLDLAAREEEMRQIARDTFRNNTTMYCIFRISKGRSRIVAQVYDAGVARALLAKYNNGSHGGRGGGHGKEHRVRHELHFVSA